MDGIDAIEGTESVAVAFRLALMQLAQTAKRLQIADVIQSVEKQTELHGIAEGRNTPARK